MTCVQCGQCAAVCPVGAIIERDQIDQVWAALDDPDKHVVVQTAPAIRAALGEGFDYEPGTAGDRQDGRRPAPPRLRRRVRHQLRRRPHHHGGRHRAAHAPQGGPGRRQGRRPAACSRAARRAGSTTWSTSTPTSCANLSTCKSPQQMFGALAKTYYAEKLGKRPEDIFVVSVMPCTAKKFEAPAPGDGRQRRARTSTSCSPPASWRA